MTGYTVHTGSTEKFAAGWDEIFKKGKKKATTGTSAARKSSASTSRAKSRKRGKAK